MSDRSFSWENGELEVTSEGVLVHGTDEKAQYLEGKLAPEQAVKLARAILEAYAPKVPMRMTIACVECGKTCEASWSPNGHVNFTTELYREHRWFVTAITPPGQGEVVLATVCGICATRVLPPELIAEFKRQRGEGGEKNPRVTTSHMDQRYGNKKGTN